jgi:isopenicillin N synthase-like dioxygenase
MINTSYSDLRNKGHVTVSYPNGIEKSLFRAVKAWNEFCALPENVRLQFPYDKGNGMGVGYELKKTPGTSRDLKEDFHFTLGKREWLANAAQQSSQLVSSELVGAAASLLSDLGPFIESFAYSLENEFVLNGLRQEVVDSQGIWFLRFLHYFGDRHPGEEIATSHADKSGFTLHLYESDPGLQMLDFQKKWTDIDLSKNETVIIPGMRLQYRSQNTLKATYHRVIATKETAREGRFAIVCFIHLSKTPEYNKEKAGRLQEFPPGFNYDMPFSEFSKLFVTK